MKQTFRFFIADRVAKFTYPYRVLKLRKHDQFQLLAFEGRPVVVKDGIRWPIAKSMVAELKKRSIVASVDPEFASSVNQFDRLGHKFLKYMVSQAHKLTKEKVVSGFKNNTVFVKWSPRLKQMGVTCAIVVRPDLLQAVLYSPLDLNIASVPEFEALTRLAKHIASHMREDGIGVRGFKSITAHARSVGTPWQEAFSGTIYSFATKITL